MLITRPRILSSDRCCSITFTVAIIRIMKYPVPTSISALSQLVVRERKQRHESIKRQRGAEDDASAMLDRDE